MDSIINLEALLNEFYHHSTSNFRKKEIERDLKNFQENESSYQIILHNLTLSMSNQYLFFFSMSTLEVINMKQFLIILLLLFSMTNFNFFFSSAYDNKKMEFFEERIQNFNSRYAMVHLFEFSSKCWRITAR